MNRPAPFWRVANWATAILILLNALPQLVMPADSALAALSPQRPDDESLLIFEIHLRPYLLSDGVFAYPAADDVLLPLETLSFLFEFPITIDLAKGRAEGWFLSEDRTFLLDLVAEQVLIAGAAARFEPDLVAWYDDDIYVAARLFTEWFPIDLVVQAARLVIDVEPRTPLPLQERMGREQRAARLASASEAPKLPRRETPYRALDWPYIDASLRTGYDTVRADTGWGFEGSYGFRLAGDLAYMTADSFFGGNQDDRLSQARLTLGRRDPDADLLGPVGATQFSLADVFTPQHPLIARQTEGRGVSVSNMPLTRASEFDRTTLRGPLLPGWEVELYRNDALIAFQRAGDDGRYEFQDVPLIFGNNRLTLRFYGPQGQRREETESLVIGADMVPRGDHRYAVAVNQQDEATLPFGDEPRRAGQPDASRGQARAVAIYEAGVHERASVGAAVASYVLDDGRHTYLTTGVRGTVFGSFVRADIARDSKGGTAAQLAMQTRIANQSLAAEHAQFFDFISERETQTGDLLRSESALRLNGTLPRFGGWQIPYALRLGVERRESGLTEFDVSNRLSVHIRALSSSNQLNARARRGGGVASTETLDGSWLISYRMKSVSMRGELSYRVHPSPDFLSVALTGDYRIEPDITARAGITRQLSNDRHTTITAGLSQRFEHVAMGLDGRVADDGDKFVGLSLSFAMGREPRGGGLTMQPRHFAENGGVSARVFLDRDLDGRFSPGDEPLEGVALKGTANDTPTTDSNGILMLVGLPDARPTDVAVDMTTLEDPYLIPLDDGWEIVPRAGRTAVLDFAVVPTGEIDGFVYLRSNHNAQVASNVSLDLLDMNGAIVANTRSAFDGFYLFEFVKPGSYEIRVAPGQLDRLGLLPAPDKTVTIGPDGDVISGVDIFLEREFEDTREASLAPAGQAADVKPPSTSEIVSAADRAVPVGTDTYVQLAAYSNARGAMEAWHRVVTSAPEMFNGLSPRIEPAESVVATDTLYRLRTGPLADRAAADNFCRQLRIIGQDCFPVVQVGR